MKCTKIIRFGPANNESGYSVIGPAGHAESRQYQAQYLDGDDLVGQLSDILSITVPG